MFCTGFWYSAAARGRPELNLEHDASPTMRAHPCLSRYCRKAPIGGEHALSCLTFQLPRILTLGNHVVPVCLAIVCVCVCVSYQKAQAMHLVLFFVYCGLASCFFTCPVAYRVLGDSRFVCVSMSIPSPHGETKGVGPRKYMFQMVNDSRPLLRPRLRHWHVLAGGTRSRSTTRRPHQR